MDSSEERIILGIDPGTRLLGFGVISVNGKKAKYLDMGVVNLKKIEDHFCKLKYITSEVTSLIEQYSPDELSIEAPFYGKNPQVMLKLGRAQGAAIASALLKNIPIFEYSPRSVKLAVTGKGAASKDQVAMMVQRMLNIDIHPKYLDATDALAIAMCHFISSSVNIVASKKGSSSWESFVQSHPDRIKK